MKGETKMKIYKEVYANEFEFWSGARQTVEYLTEGEIERIFDELESLCPEGMDETSVNDFFWFEDDTIADWLGWPDFGTLMKARSDGEWFDTYEDYEEWLEEQEDEESEDEEDEE